MIQMPSYFQTLKSSKTLYIFLKSKSTIEILKQQLRTDQNIQQVKRMHFVLTQEPQCSAVLLPTPVLFYNAKTRRRIKNIIHSYKLKKTWRRPDYDTWLSFTFRVHATLHDASILFYKYLYLQTAPK